MMLNQPYIDSKLLNGKDCQIINKFILNERGWFAIIEGIEKPQIDLIWNN